MKPLIVLPLQEGTVVFPSANQEMSTDCIKGKNLQMSNAPDSFWTANPAQQEPQPVPDSNIVTQAELYELDRLQALSREYTAYRGRLREKLQRGARVEAGMWNAMIVARVRVSFSRQTLTRHFGTTYVQELESRITPQTRHEMVISSGITYLLD